MNKWKYSKDDLPIHDQAIWVTNGEGHSVHEATYIIKNGLAHSYMDHPGLAKPMNFFYWQPRIVTDKPAAMRGPLSPKEFASAIRACDNGDSESDHEAADEVLCDLLRSLGYGEGVTEFENMTKYYS